MIAIEPWLVPLLVMAGIATLTGVERLVWRLRNPKARDDEDVKAAPSPWVRVVRVGSPLVLTLILLLIAVVTLLYGDEIIVRLTAFLTFIPVLTGGYITFKQFLEGEAKGGQPKEADPKEADPKGVETKGVETKGVETKGVETKEAETEQKPQTEGTSPR